MAERSLVVVNTTREVSTRTIRARGPARQRFTQRLAGGQITVKRGRPRTYPESLIRDHLPQIKGAVTAGAIQIQDLEGRTIDLETMQPTEKAASTSAKVRPEFPLDDANKDKNPKRPATFSTNVAEPSPQAQGETPDLLKDAPVEEDDADTEGAWNDAPQDPDGIETDPDTKVPKKRGTKVSKKRGSD